MSDEMINVEVSYALPNKQQIIALEVAEGTTVYGAAEESGIAGQFSDLDLVSAKMGVFGKAVPKPKQELVKAGDRVEIYRPLIADPKEVRKARAAKVKAEKKAAKES
ncbi:MAG: RnfH family protein [Oceanicoccus sp.]|uniref:RnfH family protein n=1 Tax=Oceanicoccus sp. TaxID=2691044 RepID=UPI002637593E|nr:RnfH family protein [Oceanicoccus sp.]MCP3908133.1 RnfH family protein [Oceanicoccus sp.]